MNCYKWSWLTVAEQSIDDQWLVHYRSVQHYWSITGWFNITGPLQVGSTLLVHYRSVQHGGFQSPVVACRHRCGIQLDAGLATGHHCVPRTNTVWGGIPASRHASLTVILVSQVQACLSHRHSLRGNTSTEGLPVLLWNHLILWALTFVVWRGWTCSWTHKLWHLDRCEDILT